jgi:hypothetical protein
MTISSAVRKAGPFLGNDLTTVFPFAFKVFTKSDLIVTVVNAAGVQTTLVLDSDYSVTLNADQDANPGGSITHPKTGSPLVTGSSLTISGALSELQPTDITNLGGFYPQVIEDALDRLTILTQQLREMATRSLKFPVTDGVLTAELPSASIRAGKTMIFDGAGNLAASAIDADGLGDLIKVTFVAGVDFTAGSTTTLILPSDPLTKANVAVIFNDKWQQQTAFSLSGTTLTFGVPIPVGTTQVEVVYSVPLPIGVPSAGSIRAAQFDQGASSLVATRAALGVVGLASDETISGNKTFSGNLTMSGKPVIFARADVAAHATSANIWVTNFVKLTGAALTITDFADAPQAGAQVEVWLDAPHTFVHSASLILQGAVNFTATAGDRLRITAMSPGEFLVERVAKNPFASSTTALAGVDATQALTAASLGAGFYVAGNGRYKSPGGKVEQWGIAGSGGDVAAGGTIVTWTFPFAFDTAVFNVQATMFSGDASTARNIFAVLTNLSLTQATFYVFEGVGTVQASWSIHCRAVGI